MPRASRRRRHNSACQHRSCRVPRRPRSRRDPRPRRRACPAGTGRRPRRAVRGDRPPPSGDPCPRPGCRGGGRAAGTTPRRKAGVDDIDQRPDRPLRRPSFDGLGKSADTDCRASSSRAAGEGKTTLAQTPSPSRARAHATSVAPASVRHPAPAPPRPRPEGVGERRREPRPGRVPARYHLRHGER